MNKKEIPPMNNFSFAKELAKLGVRSLDTQASCFSRHSLSKDLLSTTRIVSSDPKAEGWRVLAFLSLLA